MLHHIYIHVCFIMSAVAHLIERLTGDGRVASSRLT